MALLEARQLTKRFPGVVALDGVSFDLQPGEVHALCGENGAGKSTLIKTLSGIHPAGTYEGEIRVDDRVARFESLQDAETAGIAVIYQELALVDEMSVAENIFLGHEPRRGPWVDWNTAHAEAARLLERFKIQLDPETPVRALGVGQKQLVEIVKALGKQSRILILDEPTAALAEAEVEILLRILRDLRTQGVGCIYISHKLGEVMSIADRITVLRDGASIVTTAARETDIPGVIRHMVGREIKDLFPRDRSAPVGEALLSVKDLTVAPSPGAPPRLREISFEVRAGQVLGIGGLMGAGRSETLLHLFGAWGTRVSGEVRLNGQPYPDPSPGHSIRHGLVMVTDDRKRYGLHLDQPIGYNLSLSSLDRVTRRGLVNEAAESQLDREFFDALRVKAPGLETPVGGLSGGNQQKVVIGKALMTGPRVVFLDEPTRGIDVGAKLEVYQLINRLTAEGRAVVLVSSELPELMGMSDRIVMLHEGAVGGTFQPEDFQQETLMAAAMGRRAADA
ncbi:MAG: sugar ABC transporter ATP-binding protein [Verrucomicrobia bacterium]|nr:sugar ABC transporter ATP-binding protein [Verrucomicrobiota bacterium]